MPDDHGSGYWWTETKESDDPWFRYSSNGRPLFVRPFGPIDRLLKAVLKSGVGPQGLAPRIAGTVRKTVDLVWSE
jgi:hypothetical protein